MDVKLDWSGAQELALAVLEQVAGWDPVTWALAVALAAVMGAMVATSVCLRVLRAWRRSESAIVSRLEALDRDLGALCSSSSSAGDRLVSVERRSRELLARQERLEPQGAGEPRHYRHAVALLERGASAEELVQTCGMARGEAELVAFMHRAQSVN